jgi:hypothetical protein
MNRTSATVLGLVTAVGLTACASSSEPPRTPAMEAASIVRTGCGGYGDDATIAKIVDGSAVESVEPLYRASESKTSHSRLEGVAIDVRPERGVTAEWLTRALECHAARQTLALEQGGTAGRDPFASVISAPHVVVRPAGDSFRVELTVATPAEAQNVLAFYERSSR